MLARLVVLGSVLGLVGLYGLSQFQSPPRLDSQQLLTRFQEYEGRYLILEGRVSWIKLLKFGGALFKLDNLSIFLEDAQGLQLSPGDQVRVLGRAQRYKGKPELVVESINSIQILERSAKLNLSQLAAAPELFLGQELRLEGRLEHDPTGYWLSSAGIKLELIPGSVQEFPARVGAWVKVRGILSYNRSILSYQLIKAQLDG